jgi:4-amino-4-deoxy-L-arabinose transferase-like glycosyltransferase
MLRQWPLTANSLWLGTSLLVVLAVLFLCGHVLDGVGLDCQDYGNLAWQGPPIHTRVERDFSTPLFATRPAQWFSSFSTECHGVLRVAPSGTFTFALASHHVTELWLDDAVIVKTPGSRLERSSANVRLEEGQHRLRFRFAHARRGDEPELLMARIGGPLRALNANHVSRYPLSSLEYFLRPLARAAVVVLPLLWVGLLGYRLRAPLGQCGRWLSTPFVRWHETISISTLRSLTVILGAATALRVALSFATHPILWPDSEQYYDTALAHLRGDVFSHNLLSTPLYPAFMALFLWSGVTPDAGAALIMAQRVLAVGATILVYRLAREAFDRTTAFYAALIWTISSVQLYYETVVSTEALFVVILIATITVAVRFLAHPSYMLAAVVGGLCAIATLTRPVAKALVVMVLAVLWWRTGAPRTRLALPSLVLLGAFALGVAPWMYVNRQTYGFWGVSRGEGLWLFLRTIDIDGLDPPATTAYPMVREVFDALRSTHPYLHHAVRDDLNASHGYSARQADDALFGFALETVIAHPIRFAIGTVKQAGLLLMSPYRSVQICEAPDGKYLCSERSVGMRFPAFPNEPVPGRKLLKTLIAGYMDATYWVLPLLTPLALAGMIHGLRERSSAPQILLIGVVSYLTLVTALFNTVQDRYRLPADAFLAMFAIHECRRYLSRGATVNPIIRTS